MSESNNSAPIAASEAVATPSETPSENQELASEESTDEASSTEAPAKEVADLSKKDQKELAKQLKKYKLKVDGKEEDFELDLSNEEEVKKHLQMSRAASKRIQESSELRKAAEQFVDLLRTDPRKVLSDPNIGVDLKKLAAQIIDQELEDAAKSPEQLEKEKLQKELEDLRSKHKKDEDDRKQKEMERLQADQEKQIEEGIESALKSSDLPKTPYTVRKMAEIMMIALNNDIDISPKDVIPLLRKQMLSDIKELFNASGDDVLEEMVGKENISRLRKRNIAKVKTPQVESGTNVKSSGKSELKDEKKPVKKVSYGDFFGF